MPKFGVPMVSAFWCNYMQMLCGIELAMEQPTCGIEFTMTTLLTLRQVGSSSLKSSFFDAQVSSSTPSLWKLTRKRQAARAASTNCFCTSSIQDTHWIHIPIKSTYSIFIYIYTFTIKSIECMYI